MSDLFHIHNKRFKYLVISGTIEFRISWLLLARLTWFAWQICSCDLENIILFSIISWRLRSSEVSLLCELYQVFRSSVVNISLASESIIENYFRGMKKLGQEDTFNFHTHNIPINQIRMLKICTFYGNVFICFQTPYSLIIKPGTSQENPLVFTSLTTDATS